jgi:hypothetical protein
LCGCEGEFGKGSSITAGGDFLEDFALAVHVRGLETGAGGHVFPDDAWGFKTERISDIHGILGFNDQTDCSMWSDEIRGLSPVGFCVVEVGDEGKMLKTEGFDLWPKRLAVGDDVICTELLAPC